MVGNGVQQDLAEGAQVASQEAIAPVEPSSQSSEAPPLPTGEVVAAPMQEFHHLEVPPSDTVPTQEASPNLPQTQIEPVQTSQPSAPEAPVVPELSHAPSREQASNVQAEETSGRFNLGENQQVVQSMLGSSDESKDAQNSQNDLPEKTVVPLGLERILRGKDVPPPQVEAVLGNGLGQS